MSEFQEERIPDDGGEREGAGAVRSKRFAFLFLGLWGEVTER
jgi:hypothetical protein